MRSFIHSLGTVSRSENDPKTGWGGNDYLPFGVQDQVVNKSPEGPCEWEVVHQRRDSSDTKGDGTPIEVDTHGLDSGENHQEFSVLKFPLNYKSLK